MSWYQKIAKNIENHEDRNRVNHAIHWIDSTISSLNYMSELVYMTARGARKMAEQILVAKTISSYKDAEFFIEQAYKVALDNPKSFSELCKKASDYLNNIKIDLLEQRDNYVNKELPEKLKGLRDEQ